jgi:hypothetical protein
MSDIASRGRGLWLAVLLVVGGSAGPAAANFVYSTGFEAPTFAVGPLAGVDGWQDVFGDGGGQVTTVLPRSGSQAVVFDGGQLSDIGFGFLASRNRKAFNVPAAAQGLVVRTQADIRLDGPSTATGGDPIDDDVLSANLNVTNGVDGFLASWVVSSSGYAFAFGSFDESYLYQTPVPLGEYNTFGLEIDFVAAETRFLLNGAVVFTSGLDPNYDRTQFGAVDLELATILGPTDAALYQARFDNLSVTGVAVPAPPAVILAGIGAACAAAGRRLRRGV